MVIGKTAVRSELQNINAQMDSDEIERWKWRPHVVLTSPRA